MNKKLLIIIPFLAWLYRRSDWPLIKADFLAFFNFSPEKKAEFEAAMLDLAAEAEEDG